MRIDGIRAVERRARPERRTLPAAFEDPDYRAAVVDLLGAIAYGELSAFERLADDAKLAPTLRDKVEMAAMATMEFGHVEPLHDRIRELGADPFEAMAPFVARRSTSSTTTPRPPDWSRA